MYSSSLTVLSTVEHRLALVEVLQPAERVHLAAVEATNECLAPLNFRGGSAALELVLVNGSPLAPSPNAALHLAALGHFKAVEGVAVGAEEAGHEVVATAEFAALGVKLLPPILMVAVGNANGCLA